MQNNPFHSLSWGDLERWAGKAILDRGEGYRNRVTDLAMTGSGQLVATVEGGDYYLTQVWSEDGGLHHRCTCPYGGPCKHAVAVVLVYLEQVGSGKPVPEITADELEATAAAYGLVDMPDEELGSCIDPDKLRAALERMPAEEVIEWAVGAIAGHPELWDNLPPGLRQDDLAFEDPEKPGISGKTIARIRQEIRMVTRERIYHDEWDYRYEDHDDGPDYSDIERQFRNLLDAGHTEALIDLGGELFALGSGQVGDSDDDGEIAFQITDCLKLVFEAMRRGGGSAPGRLIRYWDMTLEDGYGLLDGIPPPVDETEMSRADWLRVAKEYKGRLDQPPGREDKDRVADYRRAYHRNRVLDFAVEALVKAGENGSATELMVSELPHCGNHVGLVDHLLGGGDLELARHWALEGFRQTVSTDRYIALRLAKKLQEVATRQKDRPQAAALEAEFFFMDPDADSYRQVRKACRKSGHWEQVRPFLLHYLETGHSVRSEAGWPLPEPLVEFPGPGYRRFSRLGQPDLRGTGRTAPG